MDKQATMPTIVQWNNVDLSHHHLDYISQNQMKQLHNNMVKRLKSYDVEKLSLYKACLLGKKHKKQLMKEEHQQVTYLVLFILLFCEPIQITTTHNGSKYFVIFIDDFYKYTIVYLFKQNFQMFEIFEIYNNWLKNNLAKELKF